eukprot:2473694-Rhodomonas_salina.1
MAVPAGGYPGTPGSLRLARQLRPFSEHCARSIKLEAHRRLSPTQSPPRSAWRRRRALSR